MQYRQILWDRIDKAEVPEYWHHGKTCDSQENASRRFIWFNELGKLEEGEIGGKEASQEFTDVLVRTSSGKRKDSYNSCYEKKTDTTQ